ncbi:MAG: HDOD domain-containing protein [Gammaproteobacteria bacterium]|nr:HDOD domain-containing protein [Gammaproteobacteria bacterium]
MESVPSKNSVNEVFIGRQPIYDADLNVYAYELLFRNGGDNKAFIVDEEVATAQVIVNAFMEIGIDQLVGDALAFVNFPRGLLLSQESVSLPKERIVVEILESIEVDDDVIHAVRHMSQQGFSIALDDFEYDEKYKPLLSISDIVKLDVMALGMQGIVHQLQKISPFKPRFLAEKVETKEEFEQCKALGFVYYQGYYFSRPQVVKGTKLPPNRVVMLELLSTLHRPGAELKELETTISRDVSLCYKLLRIINSASYGFSKRVDSIKQALAILGLANIKNWVSLLMFSAIDDKSPELFNNSMIRAKMCELLAKQGGAAGLDSYFTVGLFSNLDALMDQPLEDLVSVLPFSANMTEALLARTGDLGKALRCVVAYEQCDWVNVFYADLPMGRIKNSYIDAVAWAATLVSQLNSGEK